MLDSVMSSRVQKALYYRKVSSKKLNINKILFKRSKTSVVYRIDLFLYSNEIVISKAKKKYLSQIFY